MPRLHSRLLIPVVLLASQLALSQGNAPPGPVTSKADSLLATGNFSIALPVYDMLLKEPANRNNPAAWNNLAICCINLKNYPKALAALDEVYKLNRRFPGYFINRAKACSGSGDVATSVQMLDSAAILGRFGNYKLLQNDPAFENLRKSAQYKDIYERIYSAAYPCLSLPEARQFDFWIGDWDVFQTANLNTKTGFNRITREVGGCIILEKWESQGAHNGMSINYFDPTDRTWKQKWVGSSQDVTEFSDGKFQDNAMQFKWNVPNGDGSYSPGRLTFTRLAPDRVRQHSERSTDGGNSWITIYDFTYIRRP